MMNSRKMTLLWLILLVLLAAGCGSELDDGFASESAPLESSVSAADFEADFTVNSSAQSVGSDFGVDSPGSSGNSAAEAAKRRLIICVGDLSLTVEDTESVLARISQLAEDGGGWVVSSSAFQSTGDAKSGEITIRIPAAGFNNAMATIKRLALEVTSASTSGQDVTDDFVDLSSRLSNLEATAERVRNFLDSAKDVDDALAVNVELSRLEGEIELIKGRMQFLEQSAAFSTITVRMTPDVLSQPIEVGRWRPEAVARSAFEALAEMLELLGSLVIWLAIVALPLALIVVVPLWLAARLVVRRRERRKVANAIQE